MIVFSVCNFINVVLMDNIHIPGFFFLADDTTLMLK